MKILIHWDQLIICAIYLMVMNYTTVGFRVWTSKRNSIVCVDILTYPDVKLSGSDSQLKFINENVPDDITIPPTSLASFTNIV